MSGLLTSLLEPLTYPRRALWSAVGLPEHGADVLGHFGMDPSRPATRFLGAGVEMAGDPLMYAGGFLGRLLGLGGEAGEAGEQASSFGGINPALAGQVDDLLLAAVNGQGQQTPDQHTRPFRAPPMPAETKMQIAKARTAPQDSSVLRRELSGFDPAQSLARYGR